jgi:hypothetical protein
MRLGYALASLEDYTPAQVDCYGKETAPARSEVVSVESRGARMDFASGQFRATAFGGRASSGRSDVAGSFGGFQLALEGPGAGIGLGLTAGTPRAVASSSARLNAYLRTGDPQRVHFRADYLAPSETFAATTFWRVGAEFDQTGSGGVGWFVGLGQMPFGSAVLLGEFAVPVRGGLDVLLRAQAGPGHENSPWGLALGARFTTSR